MTGERPLAGRRILILEDDFYLATDARALLERAGATVVGPFGSAFRAGDLAESGALDAAVVDINLGEGPDFRSPRLLGERGFPSLFVPGYAAAVVPPEFSHIPRLEKPLRERELVAAVATLLEAED